MGFSSRAGGVLLVVAMGVASSASAAQAQTAPTGSGDAGYGGRNVWAVYREPAVEVPAPTRGPMTAPVRVCVRLPLPNQEAPPAGRGPYSFAETLALARATVLDRERGSWHTLVCYRLGEEVPYLATLAEWNPADPVAGNGTTIDGVEAFARQLLETPPPVLATNPPPRRLVTGLETWFAASVVVPSPRSVQAGPLWATARAVPARVTIDPGDGAASLECAIEVPAGPPAPPNARPQCLRHTYTRVERGSGALVSALVARTIYDVFLVTSDNPAERAVDELVGEAGTTDIAVREIQTVLR